MLAVLFDLSREGRRSISKQSELETCIGLIWSDRVNLSDPGFFVVVVFVVGRGQSEQQSGQFSATIDQSDIRGSEPHNLDPSGAASDCYRESG
jgi:hypothetical protein